MALELRGSNLYYYQKERDGDKVRSVYYGKGEMAHLFYQFHLLHKRDEEAEKQYKNSVRMREMSAENELDSVLESFCEMTEMLTDAFFLTNGFHQHKRQWRKKRDGKAK